MLINEFFNNMTLDGRRTEGDDNTALTLGDLRKSRLTLSQLHKLRLMNVVRKLEKTRKITAVKKQYTIDIADNVGL